MGTVTTFFRLARMRRSAGATPMQAVRWAAALVWRDLIADLYAPPSPAPPSDPHGRARLDRRADVERRTRQRR